MIRYDWGEPRLSKINQDIHFERSSTKSKIFWEFLFFEFICRLFKVKNHGLFMVFYSPNWRLYSAYRGLILCCTKNLCKNICNSSKLLQICSATVPWSFIFRITLSRWGLLKRTLKISEHSFQKAIRGKGGFKIFLWKVFERDLSCDGIFLKPKFEFITWSSISTNFGRK